MIARCVVALLALLVTFAFPANAHGTNSTTVKGQESINTKVQDNCLPLVPANASCSTPQYEQATSDLSSWVGWLIAGSAPTNNELDAFCNNLSSLDHGRWSTAGLIPAKIIRPICEASHAQPNASVALPYVLSSLTDLSATWTVSSFTSDSKATLAYLCHNTSSEAYHNLGLDPTSVLLAICTAAKVAGPPLPPDPPQYQPVCSTNAVYWMRASQVYAVVLAGAATSDTELNQHCAHAGNYVQAFNHLLLNGTLVQTQYCAQKQPISVLERGGKVVDRTSLMFSAAISSLSNARGYSNWLAANLNVEGANSVGLNGALLKAMFTGILEGGQGERREILEEA